MTMREIAGQLGVSVPTLYRRIKAEGVNVAELRDEKTGKVTPAGAAVIADIFRGATDNATFQEVFNGASQSVLRDTLSKDADATVTAAVCAAKLEAAEATIKRLEADLERIRGERDRLLDMLEAEQRQRQQLLTEGTKRGSFMTWLRGIGKKA